MYERCSMEYENMYALLFIAIGTCLIQKFHYNNNNKKNFENTPLICVCNQFFNSLYIQ